MINQSLSVQRKEILDLIGRIMDNLALVLPSAPPPTLSTKLLAEARRQIGDVRAKTMEYVKNNTLGIELLACFVAARVAGTSLAGFARVRNALLNEDPVNFIPSLIVPAALLYCLTTESRIVAAMTFTSRDDAETMAQRMKKAFDDVKEVLADDIDPACYQSMVTLASSLTSHLTRTALVLPRIVEFNLAVNYPALKLSYLIYCDATRTEQIVAENRIVHPAFCPRDIRALSN